ncbi:MAG: glutathione peroxidase [Planctomycetales bacterium]
MAEEKPKKEEQKVPTALDFEMKTLDGDDASLSKYQGQVVLVVNVASQCGLTPQYKQLQALHKKYSAEGLAVVGFPCNQFGKQEPGTSQEIQQFCKNNYGVEFDLFEKIEVNGEGASPLYKHLTQLETSPQGSGEISWNFEKFLIDRNGDVVARWNPRTKPDTAEVTEMIESKLAEK